MVHYNENLPPVGLETAENCLKTLWKLRKLDGSLFCIAFETIKCNIYRDPELLELLNKGIKPWTGNSNDPTSNHDRHDNADRLRLSCNQ